MSNSSPPIGPKKDDANFINDAQMALLIESPKAGRYLMWSIVLFLLCAVIWASLSELDTVTSGEGKVIPSSQMQVVQNLEGGLLDQLLIKEGEVVSAGQLLMVIDDTRFQADFREREQQQLDLRAQAVRLQAELNTVSISSSDNIVIRPKALTFPSDWPSSKQAMVARQQAGYNESINNIRNQVRQLEQQINQRKQEYLEAQARLTNLRQSYRLAKSEYDLTRPLADEGVVSQVEILKLERQTNDTLRELKTVELQLPGLKSGTNEAVFRRNEAISAFRSDKQTELNQVQGELAAMDERRIDLADKVQRTQVQSPVSGIVQKIHINTVGGVIQPGADLVEIVPSDDKLLIEAKIAPQDIAFLRPGLDSIVKFSAYDFTRYGGLQGQLEHISADTIVDEEGNAFYLVRIRTDANFIGNNQQFAIIPGMTASVDIISGKRTVLDYITKPVRVASHTALREL
ncbi:HlyD family type I secretion periplasmic adaptor subunit [uncultured Ferrimonas sp.]|uniref:HlyD family type I secretion periplasmic adaptor subunit n=1 Tax=uncultured Ferrimonas sp. TaxID=432640 RepID=UPI002633CC53|nr:HlyD family type I secretion periplasmic adaptor subunit [uncultured Ferrimonas sp.]